MLEALGTTVRIKSRITIFVRMVLGKSCSVLVVITNENVASENCFTLSLHGLMIEHRRR